MQLPHLRKPPVYRVVVLQMMVTVILAAGLVMASSTAAISALLGGSIAWIPHSYLVLRMFSHSGAHAANHIVQDFYRGEAGKFVLTACGFVLVFTLVRPLHPVALFGAFILVQAVNWMTPLLLKAHR